MSANYKTVNDIKLYPIEYLLDKEIIENDIDILLDNDGKNLKYSIIVSMFKFAGYDIAPEKIINMIRENNSWITKYSWTKSKFNKYENILKNVFSNIYQYKDDKLDSYTEWFMIFYGLKVK